MAYKSTLCKDIDEKLNELEYEITGEMTLKELYAALIVRYCHPIRRFDQFNNLLGAGYYERYWKVKGIERAKSKQEGGSPLLAPTCASYVEEGLEGKNFIDLVDDFAIRNSKDCNTPCENILREVILSRVTLFYMDILTGLYASLKEEKDVSVDFKNNMADFVEDIFDPALMGSVNVTDEIKDEVKEVISVFTNGRSEFINNFLLEEASVLLYDRHALFMDQGVAAEELEENPELLVSEKLKRAKVVLSDLVYTSDMTYQAFVELVYAGLFKIAEGNKDTMISLVENEIEAVKESSKIKEENGRFVLDERVFKNVNEIADTTLNAYVKTVLENM